MTRLTTRAALPVLLVALALGTSACSDDEPTADPGPTSTGQPTTASTTPPLDTPTSDPTEPEPTETTEPAETTEPTATPDPDGLPTTYDEGVARLDEAQPDYVQLEQFRTAADTYCLLRSESEAVLGCELGSGAGIPDPGYCGSNGASQNVGRIEISNDAVTPVCNSDTIREGGAELVPVGGAASSAKNGIRCLVEEVGVTCVDDLRSQGFFLGPERYIVFTG